MFSSSARCALYAALAVWLTESCGDEEAKMMCGIPRDNEAGTMHAIPGDSKVRIPEENEAETVRGIPGDDEAGIMCVIPGNSKVKLGYLETIKLRQCMVYLEMKKLG